MTDTFCPVHKKIKLLRLHINGNQANKYNVQSATKFWICMKCDNPYEVIPHETVVLLAKGRRKGSHKK